MFFVNIRTKNLNFVFKLENKKKITFEKNFILFSFFYFLFL